MSARAPIRHFNQISGTLCPPPIRASTFLYSTKTTDPEKNYKYKFDTAVQTLHKLTKAAPEGTSNRRRFMMIKPDPKTLKFLDEQDLGTVKVTRFLRNTKKFEILPPVDIRLPFMNFFAGAETPASFPKEILPGIAFVGRSNVGKSTLLNILCESTMARVSDKPGLTQQLNFYAAGRDFHLIDMPGYGFAFAKDEKKETWVPLHVDQEFLTLLDKIKIKYQLVMTKCDLVHREDLARRHLLLSEAIKKSSSCVDRIFMVSAKTGGGMNLLRKEILHIVGAGKKYLGGIKKEEHIARIRHEERLEKRMKRRQKR
ncbi:hypothetical protein H4219_000616 [Mycoemilia scoparia]|uniref:G domain-containing protein n=1 Tax=Mycoemilia scoparia TaxID=417184 RepID=A0A9W8DWH7_9FUNG|nr:hypothetical protein H4219_000616 [Mycoemilia scoparia]